MLCSETPPFFAMAYGFVDRTPEEKVEWLATHGYDGIAPNVWNRALLEELRITIATEPVQSGRFQVYGIYFPFDLDNPQHREIASAAIVAGAPVGAPLWITFKPTDATEAEIVTLLQELCNEAAKLHSLVVLYPHDMTWCLDVEDTLRLIDRVQRPNLFTSLHLHQELRAGNADRLAEIIAAAAPFSRLVSISGANLPGAVTPGSKDWSDVVQPLAESAFPVESFYRLLRENGYVGPVGLQNWRIPGDPEQVHARSLEVWRSWNRP